MTEKIAVLGSGMMGSGIIKSLIKGGYKERITATDCDEAKVKKMLELGISATSNNRKASAKADIIFICVKPNIVKSLLKEINKEIQGKIVVSVAATISLDFLEKTVPGVKFVRIMPNLAVLVQASYTVYICGSEVTINDKDKLRQLLGLMGKFEEVEEKFMDALTGLSGSGPGYLSIIIESMMYAGLKLGLPREIALEASAQTMKGTAQLILELKEQPAIIRDKVTTPGGTTIEAIYSLEGSQVRHSMMQAIEKAAKKSQTVREKNVEF